MASESYVVRIYRRDQQNPEKVADVVEAIIALGSISSVIDLPDSCGRSFDTF